MPGWLWSIVLLAVGLAVIVLEVFVPSGGVLGFVSFAALVGAVATAFAQEGALAGFAVLGATIVLVPSVLLAAFRWFPLTPLGRRVLPPPPDASQIVPHREAREALKRLVGTAGVTTSELVPWGRVQVAGADVEAMSEGGVIAKGESVEVVGIEGMAIVVRRREPPTAAAAPPPAAAVEHEPEPSGEAAALNRSLEEFDFETLDRPPA